MSNLSIFDIAGPIMVGPSSSHTAGACKIGQFARALFHATPQKVTFYLHGSFGEVYKGHATDRALLAGVLKMRTSDPRLKDSFEIAKQKGIAYEFIPRDLGKDQHPNTVKIVLENSKSRMEVMGRSIGGGMIEIFKVDNFKVNIKGTAGRYLSLVICHKKDPNLLLKIQERVNLFQGIMVAAIEKCDFGEKSLTILSLEGRRIKLPEVMELEKSIPEIEYIRSLSKLEKQ
ncbi:L-serine ammonia-lyase, iron-sulfur-dependent, subunit beta [Candidatus Peregrinibacteria bacterium]|nr:L-serine ammonia-lyase, iron-sulfur-dependent, subunit beta [Candidatus Peregrinibacteria bacterium]